MQYAQGRTGRVFFVRIDHGENLEATLRQFIAEKKVECGIIRFIGALQSGAIVTGPEEPCLPPDQHYESFSGGWEVVGLATITPGQDGPHLHLHASIGRGDTALTGCLRGTVITYIIVEAVITEIEGIRIHREMDPLTGMVLPVPGL